MDDFEETLYGPAFLDPDRGYRRFIDLDSFVDRHWLGEFTRNMDAYWSSVYLQKDRGGKLKMEPIWDWDLSYGNSFYLDGWKTNGWRWSQMGEKGYLWFNRMFEDPDFLQRYIDRWTELRTNIFATSNILARVDRLAAELREAQARNYERWPNLGHYVHPNWFIGHTYEAEVNWLKDWIAGRLAWIDSHDYPAPRIELVSPDRGLRPRVTLSCQVGTILYTLDGSDPRLAGGKIAPQAEPYREPVSLNPGQRLCARAHSEHELWSPPVVLDGLAISQAEE